MNEQGPIGWRSPQNKRENSQVSGIIFTRKIPDGGSSAAAGPQSREVKPGQPQTAYCSSYWENISINQLERWEDQPTCRVDAGRGGSGSMSSGRKKTRGT